MTMPYEHQARWLADKAKSPAARARAEALKASLRSSLAACQQTLAKLMEMLDTTDDFPGFYMVVDRLAEFTRILARVAHGARFTCDWEIEPLPEFTDHYINQYYLWPEGKRAFWLEGAVMSALAMKRGGRYLELCCGGGFYADMFYASLAAEIVAVDFDPRAIEMARRHHARDNVRYEIADIREGLPAGTFDGVIWDGAIEHFSTLEIDVIVKEIVRRLVPGGLLSGYTVAASRQGLQHPDHEQEFEDMDDLVARLKPYFKNVLVFESIHPTITPARHNLFFFASDGVLPFDPAWPHCRRPGSR
jgi:SAM-dependent methyltransferase